MMANPYAPPIFGALITDADPEGHDGNFLWDDSEARMLPTSWNRPFITGLTAQGEHNDCTGRTLREAANTLTNHAGTPLDFSVVGAYCGGWAQANGGLGVPMPTPDPGLVGGVISVLQWAAIHGVVLTSECSDAGGMVAPSLATYEGANRTIDFAELGRGQLLAATRAACNMGLPVLVDLHVAPEFFNIAGPIEGRVDPVTGTVLTLPHVQQYSHPEGVPGVPPNKLHCVAVHDITPTYVVCSNHQGPSQGDGGLVALDLATFNACAMRAFVITRIGTLTTPPVPEPMICRPCPGRESLGPQFTLKVRRFMLDAFHNPAYGTLQQRAAATLAAMAEYGVTREEVCYCTPVDRATLDAFLAQA